MHADTLTSTELAIRQEATRWAKGRRKEFARDFTDIERFPGEQHPVAVFMAGSPGAGKTEASKALVAVLGGFLRIDPDEFRHDIPGYEGSNSWLVQPAVSYLVEAVLDRAFKQKQSFLLDGTLSSLVVAQKNIQRCLDKDRAVQILYVYQEPHLAWEFVKARESLEGRRIPADRFVHQFFESRNVVEQLKETFLDAIKIDVLLKNTDGSPRKYHANVRDLKTVVPLRYSRAQVAAIAT